MVYNIGLLAILAAILVIVIAAMRRRQLFEIQGASLLVFGQARTGVYLYSFFYLPGTVLHELSHWLMAEILQVPTGKLTVLPTLEAESRGEEKLGYVMTGHADPFRSFLIGFAPFFTGILTLIVLGYILDRLWLGDGAWWQIGLVLYGLVVVSNSMIVSSADRRNWPLIMIFSILVGFLLYLAGVQLPPSLLVFTEGALYRINQALGLTIGLNLAMILMSYAIRRSLERFTNKRVMRGN